MSTVNISLPLDQLHWIDSTSQQLGFTNRSEFIRNIIRFLSHRTDLLVESHSFPFIAPSSHNKKEVFSAFAKTNKYSKAFLLDLEQGLSKSSYFK